MKGGQRGSLPKWVKLKGDPPALSYFASRRIAGLGTETWNCNKEEQHFISEKIGLICIWLWNTGNNSLLKRLIFPTLLLFSFLNELDSLSVPQPDGWSQENGREGGGHGGDQLDVSIFPRMFYPSTG